MNVHALIGLVSLAVLLLLFYGPWQSLCIDTFRQYAFEQRDKLFDMACGGNVSFDSAEYRRARLKIEATIRFAHRSTFTRVLFLWKFCPDLSLTNQRKASTEPYNNVFKNVQTALTVTMLFRSGPVVLLMLLTVPVLFVYIIYVAIVRRSFDFTWSVIKNAIRRVSGIGVLDSVVRKAEIESHCV